MTPPLIDGDGGILLLSCYEMGQPPLGLVFPASLLRRAGFRPAVMDLSVESLDEDRVRRAHLVAISVPMHTAMRMGVGIAERVRSINPRCRIAFYGLYAALNADYLLDGGADACFGAEGGNDLVKFACGLRDGREKWPSRPDATAENRATFGVDATARAGLPPMDRYATLEVDGEHRAAASVLATRGCKHRCRHCPIPALYDGKFYALPVDVVMADVRSIVAAGARHVTFADPDFLNGPTHARRMAAALHAEFPYVTFDFTTRIEHILRHRDLMAELRDLGCVFIVSAIETMSARTLAILDKGHTPAEAVEAVRLCRALGLTLRPSFVPFTPWDTIDDYRALLRMVEDEGLVDAVDPVQYSLRLLVPPGSLLLKHPEMRSHLRGLARERFTHIWRHPDPRMDDLQARVTDLVTKSMGDDTAPTFWRIRQLAHREDGQPGDENVPAEFLRRYPRNRARPPRLSEDWFC